MRIGVFTHRMSQRHPTGISRYVWELVRALAELTDSEFQLAIASTREREAVGWVPDAVESHVVPWPRRPVQAAWLLGLGPRLERSLGHLDALHMIQQFPPVKTAAPQIVTVHDLFPLTDPDWYRRSEQWTYRRSLKLQLERARRILVPSTYVARGVERVLAGAQTPIEIVPYGVSGVFSPEPEPTATEATCARFGLTPGEYVVCVGAVSARKNLIPLIRAFPYLPGAERVPLVLIGPDGHRSGAVDAEIAQLDGSVHVRRTGFLPDADTAALVAGAAALAHPALAEGFGFVPLEAMAARTPVIASAVASIPEVVGDAALLVDAPTDPEAWAHGLSELLGDPKRRAALADAGARRAAEFTWRRYAARLLDIYADVASA